MQNEDFFAIAKTLIDTILELRHTDAKWLELECEVNSLFKSLPAELIKPVEEMFADSGAGEALYMSCSGIRFQEEQL